MNIFSLSVDDAALSALNPFPGKLFNSPGGVDVREGCELNKRGEEATLANFRNFFSELSSTENDNIFLNLIDHGCSGNLLFADGVLSASSLVSLLCETPLRFANLLIFVEACESGGIFAGHSLPPSVLAVSASNASEASWGVFCPTGEDLVRGVHLGTCLGDLFSINWMEGLGSGEEMMSVFLDKVAKATFRSEVSFFGDSRLLNLKVGDFFGYENNFFLLFSFLFSLNRCSE